MNYFTIYNNLINKAKSQQRIWHCEKDSDGTYYERHHIVPRCMGGEGALWEHKTHPNIVLLTAREHFIAHLLLHRAYPEEIRLQRALWALVNFKKGKLVSAKLYAEVKALMVSSLVGRAVSDETKQKLSEARKALKGKLPPMTEEHKKLLSTTNKGVKKPWLSERNKLNKGRPGTMTGRKHTPESLEKIKAARALRAVNDPGPFTGKKHTQETIDKIKATKALKNKQKDF